MEWWPSRRRSRSSIVRPRLKLESWVKINDRFAISCPWDMAQAEFECITDVLAPFVFSNKINIINTRDLDRIRDRHLGGLFYCDCNGSVMVRKKIYRRLIKRNNAVAKIVDLWSVWEGKRRGFLLITVLETMRDAPERRQCFPVEKIGFLMKVVWATMNKFLPHV